MTERRWIDKVLESAGSRVVPATPKEARDLAAEWRAVFVQGLDAEFPELRSAPWLALSVATGSSSSGEAAEDAFNNLGQQEQEYWVHEDEGVYAWRCLGPVPQLSMILDSTIHGGDLYVTASAFRWTLVLPHEGDGPFFSWRPDEWDDEERAHVRHLVRRVFEVPMGKRDKWR